MLIFPDFFMASFIFHPFQWFQHCTSWEWISRISNESPDSDGFNIFNESLRYATQKPKEAVVEASPQIDVTNTKFRQKIYLPLATVVTGR